MIFDMYTIDHLGSSSIAKKLAELGITAPDGGQFARTTVRMILTNPIYTGRIVWNRKKRVKNGIEGLLKQPPEGDIKQLKGYNPACYRLRIGKYRII